MSTEQPGAGEMKAITISRLYGSGGGEIGARVARRLNWHLIDHEIVARVARELGIPETTAQAQDEYAKGFIARVIGQFVGTAPTAASPVVQVRPDDQPDQERYQATLRHVVETAADSGSAVIIGRASQIYLATRRDVLHVFIEAPLQARIAYVALRENLDSAGARERVQLKDGDRARYFRTVLRKNPDDPMLYDLVINTGVLPLDWAVDLICRALEEKTKALSLPQDELGPARGMAPYPGQPADIRPPEHLKETQSNS
jgi:cytidylate kinase